MKITRRRFLEGASAAAATAGVGKSQAKESAISIALAARAVGTMNPTMTTLGADNWVCRQLFDTLVIPEDGTFAIKPSDFRPNLAVSWESSADAKSWTYRLRQGALWHKGYGELTSDDVKFTFDRLIDRKIVVSNKVLYANIAGVEAPDKYTVRFTLKGPDPLFAGSSIYTMSGNILPRKAFEERGDKFALDPVGSGPYQVDRVDLAKGVFLKAFPQYFAGAPATAELQVLYLLDTSARTLAFLSGQTDMIEGVRNPGWMQSIKQRKPDALFDGTKPGSVNTLLLNITRKPLDDLRVRQAIRYAIDNKALAEAYGPMGARSC